VPESGAAFDTYQGMTWAERSRYGVYGVALDYADRSGAKNAFLDAVHQQSLHRALASQRRRFSRALDFGCGGGRLVPLLAGYAGAVYGIDRTPECLALAREANVVPPDRLVLWRDGPFPFAAGYFELVLCVYVLLRMDLLESLVPVASDALAPGGVCLVLEQLDAARGLTPDAYKQVFARNGLVLEHARIVRRSSGSLWLKIASRRVWPRWVTTALACAERTAAGRGRLKAPPTGYADCLFVARKRAAAQAARKRA
jgi:SAM-dependent methyltransferase